MIMKFDHISYVAPRERKEELTASRKGLVFCENNLDNLAIKAALMQYPQKGHDLYFYDETIPTEYIFYDHVGKETSLFIRDGIVYGSYFDKKGAVDFLTGIFGRKMEILDDVIRCNMKGVLDKKDYWLELRPGNSKNPPFLDGGGYGTIAVITNVPFHVVPYDGECTAHGMLCVNNRLLDICFTRSDSVDVIFEMVTVKTGE